MLSSPTSFCTCSRQWSHQSRSSPRTCGSPGSSIRISQRSFGIVGRPIQSRECCQPGNGTCHRTRRFLASLTGKSGSRHRTSRRRGSCTHCPSCELARERACICTFARESPCQKHHLMASYVCSRIPPRMYRLVRALKRRVRHSGNPLQRAALEGTCSEFPTDCQLPMRCGSCNRPRRATCRLWTLQCTHSHRCTASLG